MGKFYWPFKEHLDEVSEKLASQKGILDEPTGETCEKCGRPMLKKLGKFGFFLACSGFPECRNAKPLPLAKCPKCDGSIVSRKSKGRGRVFYGCTNYPECDFITHFKPTGEYCPKCGWPLVEKNEKKSGAKIACCNESCGYEKE
jgi:DNA topoisomerase-1